MRLMAAAMGIIALAVVCAAASHYLWPGQTLAVLGTIVALGSLMLELFRDLLDEGNLEADLSLTQAGDLLVRLFNNGRRPVKAETGGFAARRIRRHRYWFLSHDYLPGPCFPVWGIGFLPTPLLVEQDSRLSHATAHGLASCFPDEPPKWLWIKCSDARIKWWQLPAGFVSEFPTAQAWWRQESERMQAAQEELERRRSEVGGTT
ncbi:MAG: hypothetical protein ABSE70_10415 [Candidatus Limnocylindrales bacterium]